MGLIFLDFVSQTCYSFSTANIIIGFFFIDPDALILRAISRIQSSFTKTF